MKWWRVFIDKLTGGRKEDTSAGPRRRQQERFGFKTEVKAKCDSWPGFVDLFTGDVSEGGLYVPTEQAAQVGEKIAVEMSTPDGNAVSLTGTVVNVVDAEHAAQYGKLQGLGIHLDPPTGDAKVLFDQLIERARADVPTPPAAGAPPPIDPPKPPPPPPPKPAAPAVHSGSAVVGIDLGTTYTSVAAALGRKIRMCPFPDGRLSSPSVVAFPDQHKCVVGADARARLGSDPLRTVSSPKRLLGRRFDDQEIQGFLGSAPYRTLAGPDGSVLIDIWQQEYAIVQLISYLLVEARDAAETALGGLVKRCVMTCPVSFDEERTQLLRRAAQIAGLEVVALIDEPSAAALANRFDPNFGGIVGVYDFGGGTFDFSLVDVSKGDFVVLATAGDTWLGGDDFDTVLADAAANQFWKQHQVDLRKQAVEWQKLIFACERAKRELSVESATEIHVPEVLRTAEGMVDLRFTIDRANFDHACAPIIKRSLDTCQEALELMDIQPSELSSVYLSGGTTYIPAVRAQLAAHFGVPVHTGVPPEHAVCLGAAIHAAQLQYRIGRTTLDARDD